MKRSKLILFFVLIASFSFAQFKNNKWLMGYGNPPAPNNGTKIEFNNNVRIVSYDPRQMWFSWNFSGLSDKEDNWFIYTNGGAVCNKNHDVLINGLGLSPGGDDPGTLSGGNIFLSQSLFLPFDSSNTQYLFHSNRSTCIDLNHPLYGRPISLNLFYSKIDPSSNNGAGEILLKNKVIIEDTLSVGKIASVRHANGRDWWVFVRHFYEDKFYSILVTPDSVYAPVQNTTGAPATAFSSQVCISPDGKHYAAFSNIASQQLRLYDVDRCAGKLENYRQKFITNNLAGRVAFSPNSRFLYIGSADSTWQFDMQAPDVFESQTLIGVYDGAGTKTGSGYYFSFMWLAPDGKIYMSVSAQLGRKLHVINNPDLLGIACDLQQHSIDIPTYNDQTTPTPINYDLKQEPGSPCDTLGVGLQQLKIKDLELQIFPNPSSGKFSMEYLPQTKSGMLYVYDMQGKEVYREYVSPYTSIKNLDLSAKLANGTYGVSLVFGEERNNTTILINKNN
jgi:hypothetical protein